MDAPGGEQVEGAELLENAEGADGAKEAEKSKDAASNEVAQDEGEEHEQIAAEWVGREELDSWDGERRNERECLKQKKKEIARAHHLQQQGELEARR